MGNKKTSLKEVLEPLIKKYVRETIKEMILEENLLSNVIQECVKGLTSSTAQVVYEHKEEKPAGVIKNNRSPQKRSLNEIKRQLASMVNQDAYGGVDLFEGTTPMSDSQAYSDPKTTSEVSYSPLKDVDPLDEGVDLSNIPGINPRFLK